ncbi:CHAT domain-containing protein [Lentzea sp. E54]|uniref:CHAT domain-containing protein n=1 Tax=Lentzea xerophila TaxID=3435883 RepID=UPI003DA693DB
MFRRRAREKYDPTGDIFLALRNARAWLQRYQQSGSTSALDESVAEATHALSLCAPGAPERPAALLVLGEALGIRCQNTQSQKDFKDCVEVYRELTEVAPEASRLFALQSLAAYSLMLGQATGDWRPVAEAAEVAKTLLLIGGNHDAALVLHAIELTGLCLESLPPDLDGLGSLYGLRGAAIVTWTDLTGDLSPLDAAQEDLERALRLLPAGDDNHFPFLVSLSEVHGKRYRHSGGAEDLDAILRILHRVLDLCPPDHPVGARMLFNLGAAYRDRFRVTGAVADIDEAAQYLRMAAERATEPHVRAAAEEALAEVVTLRGPLRFQLPPGMKLQYVDDAESITARANRLMRSLSRYEDTGDVVLLDRICAEGRVLVAEAGPDRWMAGWAVGPALMRRFEEHGHAADLDDAVDLLRESVARPSPGGVPLGDDKLEQLVNLGAALLIRFRRDHGGADLDEAIGYARRVVELRPGQTRYLNPLGTALIYRYEHAGRRADLDEAIEIGRSAEQSATSPAERAHAQANLGNRLRYRFWLSRERQDIDAAIDSLRAALDVRPVPSDRLNLGLALRDRGLGTGDRDDLAEAAEQYRAVIAARPEQAPDHQKALLALAQVLADLGMAAGATEALTSQVAGTTGSPIDRMDAFVTLARLHAGDGEWESASRVYADAVDHLHQVLWRGLARADRERLLARWPTVACDAAAAFVATGEPRRAVELLDHGRSLLWGQTLDTRADLRAHPDLAARLAELRAESDALGWADSRGATDVAERRRALAHEWDTLVTDVRARPGFERFLLPTPFTELAEAAADGPVVLVNVSELRCDALVVTDTGVHVVELRDLTPELAENQASRYLDAVAKAGAGAGGSAGSREQVVLEVLEWLWETVAAPVLASVSTERVWWCPTGPLALMPLHAAGFHDPEDEPGSAVLDRVVSSTTPTLRALLYARRASAARSEPLLVIACADRPAYVSGLPDLPSAAAEAGVLRERFPHAVVLTGAEATRARVVESLPRHTRAHFACHGGRDGLYLADALLNMADIAGLDLDAELVVLSACHTAMGGDLPDEASHVAAAMQVAGARQVVSTLWAIGDDTAALVTDLLYGELAAAPARAARALHAVVRLLRDEDPYRPSRWAPFVHFGQ